MRLTDNEIRDITRYLEAGKPLPDMYRFLLFEEKLEVEGYRSKYVRILYRIYVN